MQGITRSADQPMARRLALACVAVTMLCGAEPRAAVQPAEELIDRTMAIVDGHVVTLSDVHTAIALGLVDVGDGPERLHDAAARLVDRTLILREVERYAPQEPSPATIDEALMVIRTRRAPAGGIDQVLAAGGLNDAGLRAWVRDDLRIARYLDQRFAALGTPTDEEASAYLATRRDGSLALARERLAADRRAELIADWIADLRRRSRVIELWKVP
jgi:hypothetical protein